MRTYAAVTALVAIANAGRAHDFFAENNYICELCKQVVDLAAKGAESELDVLYSKFPKLEDRIVHFMNEAELFNLAEPE